MTRTLSRITILSLALAALAAPTALARPDAPAAHAHRSAASPEFLPRPVIDRPSAPPSSRPAATPAATPARATDHVTDWAAIGISLAAGVLAVGAAAGIASRTRRTARA
jgi:hypothetical protein